MAQIMVRKEMWKLPDPVNTYRLDKHALEKSMNCPTMTADDFFNGKG